MRRIRELDAIRGLAAIAIVVLHIWLPQFGWLGYAVNLFFVLSGYLITTIILGNPLDGRFLLNFYVRRALRIWPIYYVSLLAVILINPLRHGSQDSLADFPYYLTFTQEIRQWVWEGEPRFPLAFRHTWTLAIEEQFYLFWPALLGLIGRHGLPWASGFLIVSALAARSVDGNLFVLASQADSLALGGLLAALLHSPGDVASRPWASTRRLSAIGVISFLGYLAAAGSSRLGMGNFSNSVPGFVNAVKPLCINVAFFSLVGLVVLHAGHRSLALLRGPILVYLGTISFGIYLYHHIIIQYVEEYLMSIGKPMTLGVEVIELAVSLALAAVSWKFLEEPVLALKGRFRYDFHREGGVGSKRADTVLELGAVELGRG